MNGKVDRRITKSQKAIKSAFLEMLQENGFDDITVKDITQKADVSRKTFYLHFADKYDLLDTIVTQQLEELSDICEKKKDKGYMEGTVIWFRYFEQRKTFFAALFTTENTVTFRRRLLDFIMEQLDRKLECAPARQNNEVLRKFMGMAVLGVVESYVLDQFDAEIEEIAKQVGGLLEQIIVQDSSSGS